MPQVYIRRSNYWLSAKEGERVYALDSENILTFLILWLKGLNDHGLDYYLEDMNKGASKHEFVAPLDLFYNKELSE
mgnify:CR=1 FL=1